MVKRYRRIKRRSYGVSSSLGPSGGGTTRRDFRPDIDGVPVVGNVPDEGFNVDEDDDFGIVDRRRRLTDEAYRRAMSGEREPGARYSFSYGYY